MYSIYFFMFLRSVHVRLTSASTSQFRKWYPQYESLFSGIIRNNCSREYEAYLHRELRGPEWEAFRVSPHQLSIVCWKRHPKPPKADIAGATALLGTHSGRTLSFHSGRAVLSSHAATDIRVPERHGLAVHIADARI